MKFKIVYLGMLMLSANSFAGVTSKTQAPYQDFDRPLTQAMCDAEFGEPYPQGVDTESLTSETLGMQYDMISGSAYKQLVDYCQPPCSDVNEETFLGSIYRTEDTHCLVGL